MNTSIEALMKAAQSVPVVGEPVAWVAYTSEGGFRGITLDVKEADRLAALGFYVNPLVHVSKDCTTTAELATLREKAAQLETVALSRCADRIKLSRLEQERDELWKDAEKRDAREDRHWRAGFMDGWNAGVIGDESALKAAGERLNAAIAQGKGE